MYGYPYRRRRYYDDYCSPYRGYDWCSPYSYGSYDWCNPYLRGYDWPYRSRYFW